MKWYEWVLVLVLIFASSVLSYYFATKERKVKVLDLVSIVNEESEKILKSDLPLEEKEKRFGEFLSELQKALSSYDEPILLKQAVVGGKYEDITSEVRKKLQSR